MSVVTKPERLLRTPGGDRPDAVGFLLPWWHRLAFIEDIRENAPPHPDDPGLVADVVEIEGFGPGLPGRSEPFEYAKAVVHYRPAHPVADGMLAVLHDRVTEFTAIQDDR